MKTRMTLLFAIALAALAWPAAPSSAADSASQSTIAGASQEFVLAPETRIEFLGSKPGKDHDGGFRKFGGSITLVDSDPTKSRVDLVIHINSLWTDAEDLTKHLLGGKHGDDFFEAAKYPTAEFHSTAITPNGGDYLVTGELTIKDVRQQISFPAKIAVNGDTVTAQAEIQLPRRQFGVDFDGLADKLIYEDVLVKLNITAVPEDAES